MQTRKMQLNWLKPENNVKEFNLGEISIISF